MRLIEGAAAVIARANALAIPVIVVTNQSGIGRGLFGWAELDRGRGADRGEAFARWVRGSTRCWRARFTPRAGRPTRHPDHPARKPNPGLLLRAADAFAIELASSWIVGDRAGDLRPPEVLPGLAGGVHVATGWGSEPGEREAALACAGRSYRMPGRSVSPRRGTCCRFSPNRQRQRGVGYCRRP